MVKFNNKQIEVIEKITSISKMNWLCIDDNGRCRDNENGMRIISPKKAIKTLVEGISYDTMQSLTPFEMGVFLGIVSNVLE